MGVKFFLALISNFLTFFFDIEKVGKKSVRHKSTQKNSTQFYLAGCYL